MIRFVALHTPTLFLLYWITPQYLSAYVLICLSQSVADPITISYVLTYAKYNEFLNLDMACTRPYQRIYCAPWPPSAFAGTFWEIAGFLSA